MILLRQKSYSDKKLSKEDKKDMAAAVGATGAGYASIFYGGKKLGEAEGIKKALEEHVGILENKNRLKEVKKQLKKGIKVLEKKRGKDVAEKFKEETKKEVKKLEKSIKEGSKVISQFPEIRSRRIKGAAGLGLGLAGVAVGIKKAKDFDKRKKNKEGD